MKESDRARVVAGKYQLESLLGQGGMGEVWVATDLKNGGKIALKLLKVEAAESKEHVARFEREARIATTLVSPHITRVSDSGMDDDGTPYMALELLEGEDLQKRIKTEKVLPIAYVVRLAIQVGRGLHVAHSAGLVHRDLKPANIFLAKQGDEEIAKVLDFGIAKGNAQDANASEFTTAGAMLGTASYMSPEQIRNAKTVDHRADLWALAVVLFRSLTGQFPFEETGFDLFLALMQDPLPTPARITSLVPSLPRPLDVFFERSFLIDIDQRYPNASAMIVGFCRAAGVTVPADVLHAAATGAPISGQPASGPASMPASGQPISGQPGSGPRSMPLSGQYPAVGAPLSGQYPAVGAPLSGQYPAVGAPLSGQYPAAGAPLSGQYPAARQMSTPMPGSGPASMPVSGRAPSGGPFGQGPVSPHAAHQQEPENFSGTLMLDSLPELGVPDRRPSPAAGRPGEGGGLHDFDPDEPDNAATLFYHPGSATPVEISENKAPPGFASGPPDRRVFTVPLDEARAAAGEMPQASGYPTLQSAHLANASAPAQAPGLDARLVPAQGDRPAPRRARAAGLWILIVTLVLLAAVVGVAVFALRR